MSRVRGAAVPELALVWGLFGTQMATDVMSGVDLNARVLRCAAALHS